MNQVTKNPASEAPTSPRLSAEDRLVGILYQFVNLHECWSKDREMLVAHTTRLEETIQNLSGEVSSLSELEPGIQQQVKDSIRYAGVQIAQAVKEETRTLMNQTVYDQAQRLSQVVRQAESVLENHRSHLRWENWKTYGSVILCSLVVAVGVGVLAATLPLTNQQMEQRKIGREYQEIWLKMSPSQRKEMNRLWDAASQNG